MEISWDCRKCVGSIEIYVINWLKAWVKDGHGQHGHKNPNPNCATCSSRITWDLISINRVRRHFVWYMWIDTRQSVRERTSYLFIPWRVIIQAQPPQQITFLRHKKPPYNSIPATEPPHFVIQNSLHTSIRIYFIKTIDVPYCH